MIKSISRDREHPVQFHEGRSMLNVILLKMYKEKKMQKHNICIPTKKKAMTLIFPMFAWLANTRKNSVKGLHQMTGWIPKKRKWAICYTEIVRVIERVLCAFVRIGAFSQKRCVYVCVWLQWHRANARNVCEKRNRIYIQQTADITHGI